MLVKRRRADALGKNMNGDTTRAAYERGYKRYIVSGAVGTEPARMKVPEIDRYIGRYLGFTDISVSAKTVDIIGLNRESTERCYIPHASRQLAQESTTKQVETVTLQQR